MSISLPPLRKSLIIRSCVQSSTDKLHSDSVCGEIWRKGTSFIASYTVLKIGHNQCSPKLLDFLVSRLVVEEQHLRI